MFILHRLYRFSKTRFGQNLFVNQGESNGRALSEALGFDYTGLYDKIGDNYVDRGTGILLVKPNGPFDKAGLKRDDCILLNLGAVKTRFIQRRGKTVVLPVRRAGHGRFKVTVTVPRFTVPYPELVPSAPVSPGH